MGTYHYEAKDQFGKTVNGTLDAETRVLAVNSLRRMGLVPTGLKEVQTRSEPSVGIMEWLAIHLVYPVWTGVGVKAQMVFFRQLATMLQAGMTLSSALMSVSQQSGNGKLKKIAREAYANVSAGRTFSEVMFRYPWIFSRVQTGLIQAGESSGGLDSMIDRIAGYLEQEMDVRRMMRASTLYPKLLIVAALTVPNLKTLVLGTPIQYLNEEWAMIRPMLMLVLPVYIGMRLMLQFNWFRAGYDTIKVTVPVMGTLIRKLSMARFARALALLYSGGMQMAFAVQVASESVGNYLVRRAVLRAVPLIAQGVPASDALRRTGQVPHMVLDMLSTGEKTGNIDMTLNKVAEYYEKESESTVKTFAVVLFVVLVLAVALMIGMQVIGFWTGFARSETNMGL